MGRKKCGLRRPRKNIDVRTGATPFRKEVREEYLWHFTCSLHLLETLMHLIFNERSKKRSIWMYDHAATCNALDTTIRAKSFYVLYVSTYVLLT